MILSAALGAIFLTPIGAVVFRLGGLFLAEPCIAVLVYVILRGKPLRMSPAVLFSVLIGSVLLMAQAEYGVPFRDGYGDLRALLGLFLAMLATRRLLQTDAGMSMVGAALCGGAAVAILSLLSNAEGTGHAVTGADVKLGVATNIGPALVLLAVRTGRGLFAVVGAGYATVAATLSGYRLSVGVAAWVLVVGLFAFIAARRPGQPHQAGKILGRLVGAAGVSATIYLLAIYLFRRFVETNTVYTAQITQKLQQLGDSLSGTSAPGVGDQVRLALYHAVVHSPSSYVTPHGLGSHYWYGHIPGLEPSLAVNANTIDSGVFYMAFHFGLLLSLVIAVVLTVTAAGFLRRTDARGRTLFLLSVPLLLVEFVLSAQVGFVWAPALATGVFIGLIGGPATDPVGSKNGSKSSGRAAAPLVRGGSGRNI